MQRLVANAEIGENNPMLSVASVRIHVSQFPENVRRDLHASLRARRINHKFHYDSVKQTQKWLALHQAHSPARNDADCRAVYDRAFQAAAAKIKSQVVHVIGLGCGGGQKDTQLLKLLKKGGREVVYTPCDVSTAMVLVARRTTLAVVPENKCFPFVCDLATADDLPQLLATRHRSLVTFFGMIPNFEPQIILPKLAALVRPKDFLLFSANLAPGSDYVAGVKRILPQYDNPLTRDWLLTLLDDLGVGRSDGELCFKIETCSRRRGDVLAEKSTGHSSQSKDAPGRAALPLPAAGTELKRIVADFQFARSRRIEVAGERFDFRAGDDLRLFFSYRYTPGRVREILARHGLAIHEQWITKSEEEGVFLCHQSQGRTSRVPD